MSRVKGGPTRARKHRKIRKLAKGFRGFRGRTVKGAKEGLLHAWSNAYIGRKHKKRNMRRLWITRINAAVREDNLSYSKFIHLLKEANVKLDRKILSQLAIADPDTFHKIVRRVQQKPDS